MPSRKGLPKPDRAAAPSNSSPEAATAALRRHYLRFQRAEDTAHLFFSAACGYYVAARFAAFAHLNPVAGNLFHHAIEMYLKGGLSKTKSIRKLEKFKHKLPSLWTAFKEQTNDIALNQFDATIADLHHYEDIRYPDAILASGMKSTIDIIRSNLPTGYKGPKVSEYRICLQEIDELVDVIFSAARRNPAAYLWGPDPAREFLIKENRASRLTDHLKDRG